MSPPPSMSVLLDSARSAEPPRKVGSRSAMALMQAWEAVRVACFLGSANSLSRPASQPAGSSPAIPARRSAARSGSRPGGQLRLGLGVAVQAPLPVGPGLLVGRHLDPPAVVDPVGHVEVLVR